MKKQIWHYTSIWLKSSNYKPAGWQMNLSHHAELFKTLLLISPEKLQANIYQSPEKSVLRIKNSQSSKSYYAFFYNILSS